MRRTSNRRSGNASASEKKKGSFQLFDLKEVRAEEEEEEARARAREREEAERQAEALQQRLSSIETSYSERRADSAERTGRRAKRTTQKKTSDKAKVTRRASASTGSRRIPKAAPVVSDPQKSARQRAALNKTLDSSRNFSSVHSAAQNLQQNHSSRRSAPKAELQGMEEFWAEMETAKLREEEERRQREIQRARVQELERARQQEAVLAAKREEEDQKRREEEARLAEEKELKRQNEEAAEKWRAEEAARVRAEADKMRERQIIKAREEESRRVQELEARKIREAKVNQVREEQEEQMRRELAKFQQEEEHHSRIESLLEKSAAEFETDGALLREADLQTAKKPAQETESSADAVIGFPDVPAMVEDDILLNEEDVEQELSGSEDDRAFVSEDDDDLFDESDDDFDEEISFPAHKRSYLKMQKKKKKAVKTSLADDDLFDPEEQIDLEERLVEMTDEELYGTGAEAEAESAAAEHRNQTGVRRQSGRRKSSADWNRVFTDDELFDSEEADTAEAEERTDIASVHLQVDDVPDEELMDDEYLDEDEFGEGGFEEDDFDEEISVSFRKKSSKRQSSQSFVLPSFEKIMDAEKPKNLENSIRFTGGERIRYNDTDSRVVQEEVAEDTVRIDSLMEAAETKIVGETRAVDRKEAEAASVEDIEAVDSKEAKAASVEDIESGDSKEAEAASVENAESGDSRTDRNPISDGSEAVQVEMEASVSGWKSEVKYREKTEERSVEETEEEKSGKETEVEHAAIAAAASHRESPNHRKRFNRKRYDSMIGKLVAASLVIVLALNIFLPDQTSSELENRELKQMPAVTANALLDGTYAESVEEWQSDQFVGRNALRSLQIFLRWLGGDREENDIYYGKNGQLLENIVSADQEQQTDLISSMNTFAETYPNVRFGMMLVPDAGTIMNDSYPAFAEIKDQREDIAAACSGLSQHYILVDALGAMDTHADEKLYYKTDHHWTSLGSFYGYQAFCESFAFQSNTFTEHAVSDTFNGVLASTSGFALGEKESIEIYTPETDTGVVVTFVEDGTQTATLYDEEKLKTKDQYAVFLGGNYSMLDIKTTTDTDAVLLLFKDSFANSMIPFLTTHYKEIVVVDPRYFNGDIQEVMLTYGITDTLFLYSGNTFFADRNLQMVLSQE
ncbi:MAG: DHHW family protein [Lachnospiraceae bacterium]|nr:DHHW family protein [Lachnospiraceae bacterium]